MAAALALVAICVFFDGGTDNSKVASDVSMVAGGFFLMELVPSLGKEDVEYDFELDSGSSITMDGLKRAEVTLGAC